MDLDYPNDHLVDQGLVFPTFLHLRQIPKVTIPTRFPAATIPKIHHLTGYIE